MIITYFKIFVKKYLYNKSNAKENIYAILESERGDATMAADNSQNSFRRGVMSLVILGLLKNEDMYGYQLVQETQRRSGGTIMTQEGSLYPVLYKLLDQGLISDRKVQVGRRMTRVYYHIEPAGLQRLEELTREYRDVTRGVFRILEEGDADVAGAEYPVVSLASEPGTAGEQETEKEDTGKGGKLCPGICY